jgi:type II secretory pathway predicted ATPase ExeA
MSTLTKESMDALQLLYKGVDKATRKGLYTLAESTTLGGTFLELDKQVEENKLNELEKSLNVISLGLKKGALGGAYDLDEAHVLKTTLVKLTKLLTDLEREQTKKVVVEEVKSD